MAEVNLRAKMMLWYYVFIIPFGTAGQPEVWVWVTPECRSLSFFFTPAIEDTKTFNFCYIYFLLKVVLLTWQPRRRPYIFNPVPPGCPV